MPRWVRPSTEKRLPSRIRQGLNVESGLNDGICVPLLLIALAAAEVESSQETTGGAVQLVVEQIGYGVVGGVAGGAAAAAVLLTAGRRGWIDGAWLQVVPLAGAAASYGLALGLGGSGFIAAFVGGGVYGFLRRRFAGEIEQLLDELGGLLDAVTFLIFGAVLLLPAIETIDGTGVVYAVLSLTVIRMLPVAISMLGTGARWPTLGFLGWFGPVASLRSCSRRSSSRKPICHTNVIVSTTLVAVALSVLAHGVSASPLVRRYVAWYESHPRERAPAMESVTAADHRWRHPVRPNPGGTQR